MSVTMKGLVRVRALHAGCSTRSTALWREISSCFNSRRILAFKSRSESRQFLSNSIGPQIGFWGFWIGFLSFRALKPDHMWWNLKVSVNLFTPNSHTQWPAISKSIRAVWLLRHRQTIGERWVIDWCGAGVPRAVSFYGLLSGPPRDPPVTFSTSRTCLTGSAMPFYSLATDQSARVLSHICLRCSSL